MGRTALLWLLCLGGAIPVAGQATGTLHLRVEPDGFEYVVDHKFRLSKPTLELAEGPHHFSFWAAQRSVLDTTLQVVADREMDVVLRLPYSKEYLVHQRELQEYKVRRKVTRIVPVAVTGGALLYTALSYGKMKKAHDQLELDRTEYDGLTSAYRIELLKQETIPAHKDEFKKAKTRFIVGTGVTVLCAGATTYLFRRTGKAGRPEFIDREKLRFEGLSYEPDPQGGMWVGGLTWNFTR